ncbi:MAG: LysM peptidoglycan-binding domain-containing protein [Lentisphaerae bacterium]|nr:LysM peptidoglycan-binding domain-containing protein [Lentisphaerota bacterium]
MHWPKIMHIVSNMKAFFSLATLLCLGAVLTGCVTVQDQTAPPPASKADVQFLSEEIRRLQARLEASDQEMGRLSAELYASRSRQPEAASATQVQALQGQIEDLQRQLVALDAARAKDRDKLYQDISQNVAKLMKNSAPARAASQTGYEHTVKTGESLSAIAVAYNVKVAAIVQANNLKSADQIYVGQKLFIPQ